MSDSHASEPDQKYYPSAEPRWEAVELADLFLDHPPIVARVELVDDPDALVRVMMHDLLTELLCEV